MMYYMPWMHTHTKNFQNWWMLSQIDFRKTFISMPSLNNTFLSILLFTERVLDLMYNFVYTIFSPKINQNLSILCNIWCTPKVLEIHYDISAFLFQRVGRILASSWISGMKSSFGSSWDSVNPKSHKKKFSDQSDKK